MQLWHSPTLPPLLLLLLFLVSLSSPLFLTSLEAARTPPKTVSETEGAFWEDAIANTRMARRRSRAPANANSFLDFRKKIPVTPVGKGPCVGPVVTIAVAKAEDLDQRLSVSPNRTVQMVLKQNLNLFSGLVFNSSWSCTIFMTGRSKPVTLTFSSNSSETPAVAFISTSNILFFGISIKSGISPGSPPCIKAFPLFQEAFDSNGLTCPAIYVFRSYGIQVAKGSIVGRIDVFRSAYVVLHTLTVTMPRGSYDPTIAYNSQRTRGIIRVGYCSSGARLEPSRIVVTNSEVFGHRELITLIKGAAGVVISRNYLHDFEFAAIRCGAETQYVMDCNNNVISYNLIRNTKGFYDKKAEKGNAGIYFFSRWFNPGNLLVCNYIENVRTCLNLDFASSGVVHIGGVCIGSDFPVQIANGKNNIIFYLVAANTKVALSTISCEQATSLNYYKSPVVRNWEAVRRRSYDKSAMKNVFPGLGGMSNPVPKSVWNQDCNAKGKASWSGSVTGMCSGVPYGNRVEVFAYRSDSKCNGPSYYKCENLPSVPKLNVNQWVNASQPAYAVTFLNPPALDFGIKPQSPARKLRPYFQSCPRAKVGVVAKDQNMRRFLLSFNIARPAVLSMILNLPETAILDLKATIPR